MPYPNVPTNLPEDVERRRVDDLYAGLGKTCVTRAFIALALAAAMSHHVSSFRLGAWAAVVSVAAAGMAGVYHLRQKYLQQGGNRDWLSVYDYVALGTGTVWGVGSWILFPDGDPIWQSLLAVFYVGIAATGLLSWYGSHRAIRNYTYTTLLFIALRLVIEGTPQSWVLALSMLAFGVFVTHGARHLDEMLVNALRHQAEAEGRQAELAESEHRYRTILETSADPMWLLIGTNAVFANEAAANSLGYDSPNEVLQRSVPEISAPFQPDGQSSAVKANEMIRLANEIGYYRFEWVHQRKDGSPMPTEVTLTRIPYGGSSALFCVWRDMTEIKANHAALEVAREKALAASREKSRFLATMSHEIRTPLNAVIGISELMTHGELHPDTAQQARTIHSAGRALLSLVNDILDFSKIEAGHLVLENAPFMLVDLITEIETVFAREAHERNIDWKTTLDFPVCSRNPKGGVVGDGARLRQILVNLVSNALKFTPAGSVHLTVTGVPEGDHLRVNFVVQDTGIGMNDDEQARVFELFSQADSSTTRRFGGTGLGLSIVRQLLRAMGSEIHLQSARDVGSTFSFSLLFALSDDTLVGAPPPAVLPSPEPVPTYNHRVLIAEDVATNRMVIHAMLNHLGVAHELVSDGRQAVQRAEEGCWTLVLMDCQMPVLDGFSATREIRSRGIHGPHGPLVIVALTANAATEDRDACIEAGMNDFLAKPLTLDRLEHILETWAPEHTRARRPTPRERTTECRSASTDTQGLRPSPAAPPITEASRSATPAA